MATILRIGVLLAALVLLKSGELHAQSELGWDDEDALDSNHYQVPRSAYRQMPVRGASSSAVPRLDSRRLNRAAASFPGGESRPWYQVPPRTFYQRDLLGNSLFFGSRPLNYGQVYGTGFTPSYFGNFGNAYGIGESRSYFGNYGIGYGLGESRKY